MVTGLVYPLPIVYGAVAAGWYNATFDFESELIEDRTEQEFGWHFGDLFLRKAVRAFPRFAANLRPVGDFLGH